MVLLTGNGLNDRHRELNNKVNEAATQGVLFDDVKVQAEKSDVDRLFKIKLADKYKNVQYILETLKCGDSLYVSKALKCAWLFDGEFSHIINPDYLKKRIFPEMSFRMRRKFLTVISMHVNNDRAANFYTYCMQIDLPNIAIKFLLKTTEAFKGNVIQGNNKPSLSKADIVALIGNSFALAITVLETLQQHNIVQYLISLRYLYSVSDVEYLDLLEKHVTVHELNLDTRFGLRISKHILKKHKDRVLRQPSLYINILNKSMLTKYINPAEAKNLIAHFFPSESLSFWSEGFCHKYTYIIDKIPFEERLKYITHMYNSHYPGEEFEMNINFYHCNLYKLMTQEELEIWALKHLKAGKESLGSGQDFLWYKFVTFDKAFEPIKKYLLATNDPDLRGNMVRVLIHSAKTDRELEILFNFYFEQYANEITQYKENFVDEVLGNHKYFNFDDDCWNAFNKILYSLNVYDDKNAFRCKIDYTLKATIYAIIHNKELHIALQNFISNGLSVHLFKQETDKLPQPMAELVYQYLVNACVESISKYDINNYDDEMKYAVRINMYEVLDLMTLYKKPKSDMPDVVKRHIDLNVEEYQNHIMTRDEPFSEKYLLEALKKDSSLLLSEIQSLRNELTAEKPMRFNKLLRKLKVYFSSDLVSVKFVELLKQLLTLDYAFEKMCDSVIFGIFQIAESADKIDLVTKYIPNDSKSPSHIEKKLLYIRKAICKFVCFTRPVLPLSLVQNYVIEDYLKYCSPMIQSYTANLHPALFTKFVKFLVESAEPIQVHGIRLAFRYFDVTDFKALILDIWNNTKNDSLRLVLYRAVHYKIMNNNNEQLQKEFFETFSTLTQDIREDEDDEFLILLCSTHLPNHLLGDHILNAWQSLNNFPDNTKITDYKSDTVENMAKKMDIMHQDIIQSIVTEHIASMLEQNEIKSKYESHVINLVNAKWNLTVKYLVYLPGKDAVEQKLNIVQSIVQKCIKLWDHIDDNVYVIRLFLLEFVGNIQNCIICEDIQSCLHGIRVLEVILKEIQGVLPLVQIYELLWSLQISIIVGKVIVDGLRMAENSETDDRRLIFEECVDKFANEFAKLLNEFIDQGKYYSSAYCVILKVLINIGSSLLCKLPFIVNKSLDNIFVVMCSKLVEIDKHDTYYFALDLLPQNYDRKDTLYQSIIQKIRSYDNDEIKHFLYRKLLRDNGYENL